MERNVTFDRARQLLLEAVEPVSRESLSLSLCAGRVLGEDLIAREDVPPFDRSPYDGFALRGQDTVQASPKTPVTLSVLEEVPTGATPTRTVGPGGAVKVFTGTPIPPGADCVVMFEDTRFDRAQVTLTRPVKAGSNIIRAGETSPYSLYSESIASFTTGDLYDHHDADGFINLFGLPLKVRAMKMQELKNQNNH